MEEKERKMPLDKANILQRLHLASARAGLEVSELRGLCSAVIPATYHTAKNCS